MILHQKLGCVYNIQTQWFANREYFREREVNFRKKNTDANSLSLSLLCCPL